MSNSENMILLEILKLVIFISSVASLASSETPLIWLNFTTPINTILSSTPTTTVSTQPDTTTVSPTSTTPFKFILVSSIPANASPATAQFDEGAYVVDELYSLPPGLPTKEVLGTDYSPDYEFMTIDLLPTIINMSYLDAVNYVNRKCDELCTIRCYGILSLPSFNMNSRSWHNINSSDPNNTVYWNSYFACLQNIGAYENAYNISPFTYEYRWVQFYFEPFYEEYLLFPISCVGIFFGTLNIKTFLTKKPARNAFTALVFVQSLHFLPWTILYDLNRYLEVWPSNDHSTPLFGIMYDNEGVMNWLNYRFADDIFDVLSYLFSFVIEMIRFYKIAIRILALAAPIWYRNKISVKNVLIVCALTTIFSTVVTTIILLHWTYYKSGGKWYLVIPNDCPNNILTLKALFLSYGLQCIPEYIVIDELFPLGLLVLILDVVVIYLLRVRLKQISSKEERKRERRITIFALADGLYFLYDLSRRILLPFYNLTIDQDRIKDLYKYDIVMYNFTISMQTLLVYMRNDFRSLIFTFDMVFCYIMLLQIQKMEQVASSSTQNSTLFKKIKVNFLKKINGNLVSTTISSNVTRP